ncbi:hypothetical protein ACKFKG_24670 [Phormidesmis sp. 146-35]
MTSSNLFLSQVKFQAFDRASLYLKWLVYAIANSVNDRLLGG